MRLRPRALAWTTALSLAVAGCVPHTRVEGAARRMTWPTPGAARAVAEAPPPATAPSIGGDILKGTSPADLAAARAATSEALNQALAKP